MSITLTVPSIKCEGCADAIAKQIKTHDGSAEVSVDVANKTVEIATELSEASLKQALAAIGHQVAG